MTFIRTIFMIASVFILTACPGNRGDSGGIPASEAPESANSEIQEDAVFEPISNPTPTPNGVILDRVDLYEAFEFDLLMPGVTGNKFSQFVSVVFTKDGRKVNTEGFFNGDGLGAQDGEVWTTRFMPDEVGLWTYVWNFADDSGSGSFMVDTRSNPNNHGHVKRFGRFLKHDDGTAFFYRGANWIDSQRFHPDSKFYELPEDMTYYYSRLAETGHNGSTIMNLDRTMNNDRSSFDLSWLKTIDNTMEQMGKRGLYTILNLTETWGRDAENRFETQMTSSLQLLDFWNENTYQAEKKFYFRYLMARYAGYYNTFWELGNEAEHGPNSGSAFSSAANNYYIPWMDQYDPYDLPMTLSEGIWKSTNVDIGGFHQVEDIAIDESYPILYSELVLGGASDAMWRATTCSNPDDLRYYRGAFWKGLIQGGSGSIECSSIESGASFENIRAFVDDANIQNLMDTHGFVGQFIAGLKNELYALLPLGSNVLGAASLGYQVRGKVGEEYMLYAASNTGAGLTVTLSLPVGNYSASWFSPVTGLRSSPETVSDGSLLLSPWKNEIGVVLHLIAASVTPDPKDDVQRLGDPPYAQSTIFSGMTWDWQSHLPKGEGQNPAFGSDQWPITWGLDGNLYTTWGDGGGFGGNNSDGRVSFGVARIEGTPPDWKGINLWGGKNPLSTQASIPGKGYIAAVDDLLYVWLSKQDTWDKTRILKSADYGLSWDIGAFILSKPFYGFIPIQFGKGYQDSPDNYVYGYTAEGNGLNLVRVLKTEIEVASGYEIFSGLNNGSPQWSKNGADRVVVFTDLNGRKWGQQAVFHPVFERYILTVTHGEGASGSGPGLGVFESENPWGPWRVIEYTDQWKDEYDKFVFSFPQKWMSSDGLGFWMTHSGWPQYDGYFHIQGNFVLK